MTTISERIADGEPDRLRVVRLSKTFDGRRVLRDASLRVRSGEIHALVGANGSGKSTLVKCLTGVQPADPGGVIQIGGRPAGANFGPKAAAKLGVRVVHQDAPLIDALPLCDVLALYRGFPSKFGFVRSKALREQTASLLESLGIDLDPEITTGRLSAAERAMAMLALATDDLDPTHGVLVLDEPTASIPAEDARRFLASVQRAALTGVGVLIITHRLSEVFDFCSHVTALRSGEVVLEEPVDRCTHKIVVDAIVGPRTDRAQVNTEGRSYERFQPDDVKVPAHGGGAETPALEVRGLTGRAIRSIDLTVHAGEIVGVTGIVGSGATELGRLIFGVATSKAGTVSIHGDVIPDGAGPGTRLGLGLAYVPGDRLREGGVAALSVADNVALLSPTRRGASGKALESDLATVIETFDLRPPDPKAIYGKLSGGNQQKVVIGKMALRRPTVFVLDDPTAGVDPGARQDIFAVLKGMARNGTGVVLITTEPVLLVGLADRVVVIRDGVIAGTFEGEGIQAHQISLAMS